MEFSHELALDLIGQAKAAMPSGARLLFLAFTGSHSYGTETPTSDVDIRGVFTHPVQSLLGIEQLKDEADIPGGDGKLFSLKKFLLQILKGSPNTTELLFSPADCVIFKEPVFDLFYGPGKDLLVSSATVAAYRGMGTNQHLTATQLADHTDRRCRKGASHYYRLAYELRNILSLGKPEVRLPYEIAAEVRDIKTGVMSVEKAHAVADKIMGQCDALATTPMGTLIAQRPPLTALMNRLHTAVYYHQLFGELEWKN